MRYGSSTKESLSSAAHERRRSEKSPRERILGNICQLHPKNTIEIRFDVVHRSSGARGTPGDREVENDPLYVEESSREREFSSKAIVRMLVARSRFDPSSFVANGRCISSSTLCCSMREKRSKRRNIHQDDEVRKTNAFRKQKDSFRDRESLAWRASSLRSSVVGILFPWVFFADEMVHLQTRRIMERIKSRWKWTDAS